MRMASLGPDNGKHVTQANQLSNPDDSENRCGKLTHPDTRLHVFGLFALTLAAGFLAELGVMLFFFPNEPNKLRMALLDSLTLVTILVPFLYFLAFRPILREVETRRLAENNARKACLAAHHANKAKDIFLATVSHELRTPLSSILLRTEHLLRTNVDCGACRKAIQSIASNARIQAHLVDDLLDISRMRTGKLRLEKKSVSLHSIIHSAIDSISPASKEKKISVNVNLDPTIPFLLVDPQRAQQIIWNLLSNALKFTHHGGHIDISTLRRENWVDMRISDNGAGISPEFVPRVFDLFTQADNATDRTKGLGLGLALVRQLTELHSGKVVAESLGKGKGSVFTVSFPLPSPA